jgi:hypothetical protein
VGEKGEKNAGVCLSGAPRVVIAKTAKTTFLSRLKTNLDKMREKAAVGS